MAVAVAVLSTYLVGGLGTLAAVGVALYLLLPAMAVLRPGRESVTVAAAREAIGERPALDVLVGAWLALLLARIWGLITWDGWAVVLVASAVLVGYALLTMLLTRIVTRRHRFASLADRLAARHRSSSSCPCHDDADRLPACLAAIRAQTYADTSVLVVDTGSTDGSQDEAAAWFDDDVVISRAARPRPAGSRATGRAHVGVDEHRRGSRPVRGTRYDPRPDRRADPRRATGVGPRSTSCRACPRDLMPTVGERAAVPGFALALFGLVPLWFPALTGGRPAATAFADGGLDPRPAERLPGRHRRHRTDGGDVPTAPADASPPRVSTAWPMGAARPGGRAFRASGRAHPCRTPRRPPPHVVTGRNGRHLAATHGARAVGRDLAPALAGMVVLAARVRRPARPPARRPRRRRAALERVRAATVPLGGLILVRDRPGDHPAPAAAEHHLASGDGRRALIGQAAGIADRVRGEDAPPSEAATTRTRGRPLDDPVRRPAGPEPCPVPADADLAGARR